MMFIFIFEIKFTPLYTSLKLIKIRGRGVIYLSIHLVNITRVPTRIDILLNFDYTQLRYDLQRGQASLSSCSHANRTSDALRIEYALRVISNSTGNDSISGNLAIFTRPLTSHFHPPNEIDILTLGRSISGCNKGNVRLTAEMRP